MSTPQRRRARLATGAAVLALATLASGCSSGGSDAASANGGGDVSLRMTVWTADKTQLALFDSIAKEYMAKHPQVKKVTFDPVPFEGYTTSVTTQIAGSNPPDLAWILERDAPDFVSSGALADLKPTLSKTDGYQLNDLVPSATRLWTNGDKLYAYPFSTSPMGVFYNKTLLKKAGVTSMPDDMLGKGAWTWDQAERTAAKVAASTGKQGLVVRDWDYKNWNVLASVYRGFGARAWSDDGKSCGFDSPQMTQAMTFLHKAIFEDKALPAPGTTADFFAGESGMTITQISRASLLKDHPFDWGIVPLPSGPDGNAQVIGQAGIGVIGKGKNAKQAADFLAFFTNRENSANLAAYFPPPRQSLLTADTLAKANPMFTKEQLENVVIDGIKTGTVLPSHTDSNKITSKVQSALDPMWKPGADVPTVLSGVCKAIGSDLK
ncbi:sugar ABC transporter substrate-binding protein [Phycicoccus sp. M110.8]|uniref:ABC transporter substrate-binding protein n=1 Tax=Phycicoccus sp. M110.8 TaxID=3075433 RepID=UPI0028FD03D6|nr:sugar ABC transporter substrate-binding protein [Phycicoccus sp. M110.8]MDU0315045.1 sugar ABC transporter substrate-binding protein [Phycicoccus sp. M110.8]